MEMTTILKRQCNAYNFGDDGNSTELVTSQFSEDGTLGCPNAHIENLFRDEDSIPTRFGAHSSEKSTDDLQNNCSVHCKSTTFSKKSPVTAAGI